MMWTRRFSSTALHLAVLVSLAAGLCLLAIHQHDTDAADGHCAVCHFATGLMLPAVVVALGFISLVYEFRGADCMHASSFRLFLASPCGFRAPPFSF